MIGIYKIQSKIKPERCYIGSAVDIKRRRYGHLATLNNRIHKNPKLQAHYNKYGKEDLDFSILISCNKEDLIKHEQFFIDSLNPWFNICKIANSSLGVKRSEEYKAKQRSRKGYKLSAQARDNMSKAKLGNKNTLGYKQKEETIQKRSKALKGHIGYWHNKKREKDFGDKLSYYFKGAGNPSAKLVLNIQTGIYYDYVKEAHLILNKKISYGRFTQMLKGTKPNKTNFIYV